VGVVGVVGVVGLVKGGGAVVADAAATERSTAAPVATRLVAVGRTIVPAGCADATEVTVPAASPRALSIAFASSSRIAFTSAAVAPDFTYWR